MGHASRTFSAACLALAVCACGDSGGAGVGMGEGRVVVTDSAELTAALAEAVAGDEIEVGAGTYQGGFVVPAGVTLAGPLEGGGRIDFRNDDGPALRLRAAGDGVSVPTSVMRVGVTATGAGVLVEGPGDALLSSVSVTLVSGYGIAARGAEVELRDVTLKGAGIVGLVASGSRIDAERLQIEISGEFGAVLHNSDTRWAEGGVSGARVGIHIEQGRAELIGLSVRDGGGTFGAGVSIVSDAVAVTRELKITGIDGYGLLQNGSTSSHQDLIVSDNGDVGIWTQRGGSVELAGAGTSVMRNTGAAVYAFEPERLSLLGGIYAATTERPTVVGGARPARIGDGLQVLQPKGTLELSGIVLECHPRAALLIDGGAEGLAITVTDVMVKAGESQGEAFAFVGQNSVPTSVMRTAAEGLREDGEFAAPAAGAAPLALFEPVSGDAFASPLGESGDLGADGMLPDGP